MEGLNTYLFYIDISCNLNALFKHTAGIYLLYHVVPDRTCGRHKGIKHVQKACVSTLWYHIRVRIGKTSLRYVLV